MMLLLAGDVGGTKTILRLIKSVCSDIVGCLPEQTTLHEQQHLSQNYLDLVPMVKEFLLSAEQKLGYAISPKRACFAIAGPVRNNTSKLTNLAWILEGDSLAQSLSLEKVSLINDFAAVSYGVLGLSLEQQHTLQPAQTVQRATIAIIGAGTGLGEGFLIPKAWEGYTVFTSEGGHADFAPRSKLEFELLTYLQDKHEIEHVSVERVVSGQGIISIYQFLRDRRMASESPEIAQVVRTWEQEAGQKKSVDPAATIAIAAQSQRDPLCQQVMRLFIGAYGAEAGNLALKLLPYGGLYVAGGIATKNLSLMQSGAFMQAFKCKGRMNFLLDHVPVHVVLTPQVGLMGAALCASEL